MSPFLLVSQFITNLILKPDNSDAQALASFVAFLGGIFLAGATAAIAIVSLILFFHH